jgi:hypothetical protein
LQVPLELAFHIHVTGIYPYLLGLQGRLERFHILFDPRQAISHGISIGKPGLTLLPSNLIHPPGARGPEHASPGS